jgi:hypothetical protein
MGCNKSLPIKPEELPSTNPSPIVLTNERDFETAAVTLATMIIELSMFVGSMKPSKCDILKQCIQSQKTADRFAKFARKANISVERRLHWENLAHQELRRATKELVDLRTETVRAALKESHQDS